jgi:hypothetical protein
MKNTFRTLSIAALALAALPALAGGRIEKEMTITPGGKFMLQTDAGSVTVVATQDAAASVAIISDRDDIADLLKVRTDVKPGLSKLTALKNDSSAWREGIRVRYEIRVPAGSALDLRTPSGDLRVPRLDANAQVVTTGGRLTLQSAGDVRASN